MLQSSIIKRKPFLRFTTFKLANYATCYSSLTPSHSSVINTAALALATKGLEFKVISRGSGAIMGDFIREYLRAPILNNAEKSSLGGEQVLATLNATPNHPSSFFLMYFQGSQDKHFHGGPRLLNIFANKPWYLYAGGADLSVLQKGTIPVAKIAFPGNSYTQVRFAPNFIHGFEGEDFAAISTHYTDLEEIQSKMLSATSNHSNGEKTQAIRRPYVTNLTSATNSAYTNDKDIMEKLTVIIPQEKINLIMPEIPYDNILNLRGNLSGTK